MLRSQDRCSVSAASNVIRHLIFLSFLHPDGRLRRRSLQICLAGPPFLLLAVMMPVASLLSPPQRHSLWLTNDHQSSPKWFVTNLPLCCFFFEEPSKPILSCCRYVSRPVPTTELRGSITPKILENQVVLWLWLSWMESLSSQVSFCKIFLMTFRIAHHCI